MNDDRSAVVVLGGGMHPDGQPPPWVDARADTAAATWHAGGYSLIVTSGRGPVPEVRTEAAALADALIARGVPTEVLRRERDSTSTARNAWYVRRGLLDPLGIRAITLVSSGFHLRRAVRLFEHVLGEDYRIDARAADDTAIPADVLALLQICDDAQDCYLTEVLLPRLPAGDIGMWHDYLFNPASPLVGLWPAFRDQHAEYRHAWRELSALMAGGRVAVS